MIPTQHAVRNNHAPRNTAAPAAQSGDDSSFTPLPRGTPVDLNCRADKITDRASIEGPDCVADRLVMSA